MKGWTIAAGVALLVAPAHAEAPQTLTLEAAYAVEVPGEPGHVDAFVVINNRSGRDVTLTRVQSSAAGIAGFHKGDETPFEGGVTIPIRAELYMLPGGVHIGLTNAGALGKLLPLELEIDGKVRFQADAVIVPTAQDVPDHHSFKH